MSFYTGKFYIRDVQSRGQLIRGSIHIEWIMFLGANFLD